GIPTARPSSVTPADPSPARWSSRSRAFSTLVAPSPESGYIGLFRISELDSAILSGTLAKGAGRRQRRKQTRLVAAERAASEASEGHQLDPGASASVREGGRAQRAKVISRRCASPRPG